jgi:hypothetical protein
MVSARGRLAGHAQHRGRRGDGHVHPARNALLDGVRRTAARSGNTLASFTALEAPPTLAARHRTTRTTWERNLERLRAYALALDRAANRRQVLAALTASRRSGP